MNEAAAETSAVDGGDAAADVAPDAIGAAPATTEAAPVEEMDADTLEAISQDPAEPTVKLGSVEVPLSALQELPDDVLRQIKRKVRAAGQEREITLAEALDAVPKAEGWQKRMWEAAQQEKKLQSLAERMGTDTVGAYAALHGVTRSQAVDALSAQLLKDLEREAMSPEQRAAHDRQRELEEKAALAEEYQRKEREQQLEASVAQKRESYLTSMRGALEAVGAPLSPYAIERMALTLGGAMTEGVVSGDPTPEDFRWAAEHVSKQLAAERAVPADLDGDALLAHLGDDVARKAARAYAAKVQRSRAPVSAGTPVAPPPKRRASNGAMSWEDYLAEKDREMGIRR